MTHPVYPVQSLSFPFSGPPLSLIHPEKPGMIFFYGASGLFRLIPLLAAWRLNLGEPVLFLDGGNQFNPYPLADLARQLGKDPNEFLERLWISRAFTCHQMAALIRQLPGQVIRLRPKLILLSAPLETFYDEAIPFRESHNLLKQALSQLDLLSRQGLSIIVLSGVPPSNARSRERFFLMLKSRASRKFVIRQQEEALFLSEESQTASPAALHHLQSVRGVHG